MVIRYTLKDLDPNCDVARVFGTMKRAIDPDNVVVSRKDLVDKLTAVTEIGRGCLCGHSEWCENCSPSSAVNQIRKGIRNIIQEIKEIK